MMGADMTLPTRRQFLQSGAASIACLSAVMASRPLLASPFGLPLGLQLYSVRDELPKDYAGVLKQVAALGYRDVESAGFFGHSAAEAKQALHVAGLNCVSAHYPWQKLSTDLDALLDFHKQLGTRYIICAFPGHKDPADTSRTFSLDDWRWNAKQFNEAGAKVKAAGMHFGYHNHTMEFAAEGGVVPFEELIRLTDPALVTIEMDCGWVVEGGGDPVALLHKYPNRISMLHVKDFQPGVKPPHAAQLGHGQIDYRPIFAAAKKHKIKHYFVEQEQFDIPWQEALKVDADYMKALNV